LKALVLAMDHQFGAIFSVSISSCFFFCFFFFFSFLFASFYFVLSKIYRILIAIVVVLEFVGNTLRVR
jgi:hypothetical protein